MTRYVEHASQRTMKELVTSVTDDRPPRKKPLAFWVGIAEIVIAICAVATLVLALTGVI